jgi:hypothetical protein
MLSHLNGISDLGALGSFGIASSALIWLIDISVMMYAGGAVYALFYVLSRKSEIPQATAEPWIKLSEESPKIEKRAA